MSPSCPAQVKCYLQDKSALIIDENKTFSIAIARVLADLGMQQKNVLRANRYSDALEFIQSKPNIVISDYSIKGICTMDLVNEHRKTLDKRKHRIFIMTSSSSNQCVVAEAADGDVDSFLFKPLSVGQIQNTVSDLVSQKINPSRYLAMINLGRDCLDTGNSARAEQLFLQATLEGEAKPCLAYYYAGVAAGNQLDTSRSLEHFQMGRKFEHKHYKCTYGAFNIHLKNKNYDEAYELIQLLTDTYPVTPKKLSEAFKLAIYTKSISDLEKYYTLYKKLDHQTDSLGNIVKAGFYAAGRLELRNRNMKKAFECFKSGMTVAKKDLEYVRKVVTRLLDEKLVQYAEAIFKLVSIQDVEKKTYLQIDFLISKSVLTPVQLIERGQKLINSGQATDMIFIDLVSYCKELDKEVLAENFILRAQKQFPDIVPVLRALL